MFKILVWVIWHGPCKPVVHDFSCWSFKRSAKELLRVFTELAVDDVRSCIFASDNVAREEGGDQN